MNYLEQLAKEEEILFKKARNYILDNYMKSFTVDLLAKETGIERSLINKWIVEGRLFTDKESKK